MKSRVDDEWERETFALMPVEAQLAMLVKENQRRADEITRLVDIVGELTETVRDVAKIPRA